MRKTIKDAVLYTIGFMIFGPVLCVVSCIVFACLSVLSIVALPYCMKIGGESAVKGWYQTMDSFKRGRIAYTIPPRPPAPNSMPSIAQRPTGERLWNN